MSEVFEIYFKHEINFYLCLVSVIPCTGGHCTHIELMDMEMITLFKTSDIIYKGEKGYQSLSMFHDDQIRPVLVNVANLIAGLRHMNYTKAN